MRKLYTCANTVRVLFLLGVLTLFTYQKTNAQSITNYTFSASSGTFTPLTGGTSIPEMQADTYISGAVPIGFTFYFMGVPYTNVYADANGVLSFNSGASSSTTNNLATGTARPLIAPLWDDNDGNATGGSQASYLTTGTPGSRVFTFEWLNWEWRYNSTSPVISFQAKLYEADGKIEFIYRQESGAVASGSASIGIAATATGSGNYLSLDGTGASPTASSTSETTSLSTKPATGQVYTFTPPAGAVGNPTTLSFTDVASYSTKINWVDNSTNESVFYVTRATDAAFTQNITTVSVASTTTAATGGAYSVVMSGTSSSTLYYYKVQALNEGNGSSGVTGSQLSAAPGTYTSVATGNWTTAATWDANAVPGPEDNVVVSVGHTVSIDASGLTIGGVTVSGTLAYTATPSSFAITNNLTVNAGGVFNVFNGTTGKTLTVGGNITNNGSIDISVGTTSAGNLTLNGTAVQTVSGTGTFGAGNAIRNLTFSNTNTSTPNIIWSINNVKITYNLNITGARINLGTNKMTFGNGAAGNTLTAPVGTGFLPGAKFSRWWTTGATGTSISAGSDPTTTTSRYPFISASGRNRAMYISRSSSTTTGNTAGELAVVYTDASTITTGLSIADGAYTVTDRYNGNWLVTAEAGYVYVSGTHTAVLIAENSLYPNNGNSRIITNNAAIGGTHQNGTTTPGAQRIGLSTAALTTATGLYIGVNNADISFVSVASGDWNSGSTWNRGTVPTSADVVTIADGHTVTVNAAAGNASSVTVAAGGVLTVSGSTLTLANTLTNNGTVNATGGTLVVTGGSATGISNTATFNVNGGTVTLGPLNGGNTRFSNSATSTLAVTSGTLNVNGNLVISSGATFNQTGGNINIDGNAAGVAANSVASSNYLLSMTGSPSTISLTGGMITFVDPHVSTDYTLYGSMSTAVNCGTSHTFRFGDGVSTDAGGTNGFYVYLFPGSSYLILGNVIANGGTGTNRFVKTISTVGILGDLTVNANSEYTLASTTYVAGNIVNNGTLTSTSTLNLASFAGATAGASTNAQNISGTGVFRNASTSPTAGFTSITVNNTHATGVTLNTPVSLSSTLTLTNGYINTTAANILTLISGATATASATSYVKGPVARVFAASRTATATYTSATIMPVGKGASYQPIYIDPTTNAGGTVTFNAEAFITNAGTMGTGVTSLSTNRWEALVSNGAANLTSVNVRLVDASIVGTNKILQSTTAGGVYTGISAATNFATGTLTSGAIAAGSYTGYLSFGDLTLCAAPVNQPTGFTLIDKSNTTANISFTAAASNPSHYLVVRYAAAATPTDPTDFTSYTVGQTLGSGGNQGTVAAIVASPATTFTSSGLTANTAYDYYIYAYNNSGCSGPAFNITAPLTGSVTTCAAAVTAPSSVAISAISTTGFTVTWTAPATADIKLDIATDAGFTSFVAGYNAKSLTAGTTSEVVTGLTAGTEYYIRLRAVEGGCSSPNSTALRAVTLCSPVTNFTENFDGGSASVLPICWIKTGSGGTVNLQASNANSSPNTLYIYSSSTSSIAMISLPPVSNLGAGTNRLRFNMRANVTANGVIEVGYLTTPGDPASFVLIQAVTAANLTYDEYIVVPGVIATPAQMLAFRHTGSPANSILIDDVKWEAIPAPTINNFTSSVACGNSTLLTINGTNLLGATVTIGGTPVTLASNTDAVITANISSTLTGTITVTTGGGTANSATPFTFTSAPALSLSTTNVSICNGATSAPVTITAGASDYDTYVWAPATNVSGSAATGWTFNPTTSGSYILTSSQSAGSCSRTTTVTVMVNPVPTAVVITPSSATICANTIQALTATGGTIGNTVVSGTGASTTTGSTVGAGLGPNPLQNYYGGTKQQWLYTAAELTALGLQSGSSISEIKLELATANTTYALNNLVVKMKNTATTAYAGTSAWETGLTIVRTAGDYTPVVGLNSLVLTTPFVWDGTSSLAIEISYSNNNGGTTVSNNTAKYSSTSFVSTLFYRKDNETAANMDIYTGAATASYSARTDITFEITKQTSITWSPITGLYTDAAATVAYTGTAAATVYAKLVSAQTFTATATTPANCTATQTVALTVIPASVGGTVAGNQTVCIGNTPTTDLVLSGETGTVVKWQKSTDAAFTSPVDITSTAATLTGATIGALYQTTYFRAVVQSGSCTTANSATATITVNATVDNTTALAGTAGGAQVTASYDVSVSNNYLHNCNLIATVTPAGATPVSGNISASVKIDGTVQTAPTGEPYVQRHYDILPAANATTATSTITLYFLQSEFDAFNAARGFYAALPTNGSDATGKASLRITQYNGVGTAPGTYPAGTGSQIDPVDANIVFNAAANRWEISFSATGSGGFYVHSGNFTLPVALLSFNGKTEGNINNLNWSTATETNSKGFELQRSADGKNFSGLAFIASKAEGGNSTSTLAYSFNDNKPFDGLNYYRLKQLDKDGKFYYSKVIVLSRNVNEITFASVYPNPAVRELKFVIASPKAEKVSLIITDLTGKVVMQQSTQLVAGNNQSQLDVSALSAGTYFIKAVCANGCETAVQRFIKQ